MRTLDPFRVQRRSRGGAQRQWTLQLLADKVTELEFAESSSLETVRQILTINELKPWKKKDYVYPPS